MWGVKALPIVSPIKILAGAENGFGLEIGTVGNLIAIVVANIAPKSQGKGKCKKINKIEPETAINRANSILKIFIIYKVEIYFIASKASFFTIFVYFKSSSSSE